MKRDKTICLKVDVDTLIGSKKGIIKLLSLFDKYNINATFLLSLGPDKTGQGLFRIFKPGFLGKINRTSVIKLYGIKTLLNGLLWPGPIIYKKAYEEIKSLAKTNHEIGVHAWDHVKWHNNSANYNYEETYKEINLAINAFIELFGRPPSVFGSAGWQGNHHYLKILDDMGIVYSSDSRGQSPFKPIFKGRRYGHVQIPTNLPTYDELIGLNGETSESIHLTLVEKIEKSGNDIHVFTLHAEIEGGIYLDSFEKLLIQLIKRGYKFRTLQEVYDYSVLNNPIGESHLFFGEIKGRAGALLCQCPIGGLN